MISLFKSIAAPFAQIHQLFDNLFNHHGPQPETIQDYQPHQRTAIKKENISLPQQLPSLAHNFLNEIEIKNLGVCKNVTIVNVNQDILCKPSSSSATFETTTPQQPKPSKSDTLNHTGYNTVKYPQPIQIIENENALLLRDVIAAKSVKVVECLNELEGCVAVIEEWPEPKKEKKAPALHRSKDSGVDLVD